MFVLANDGGIADGGGFHVQRTLLQRVSLFNLVTGGMAIALLNGAEFRDSKVSPQLAYHRYTDVIIQTDLIVRIS